MSVEAKVSKSTIPQISAAAQEVCQVFRSLAVDETATYEHLTAAVGFDVRAKPYIVRTAIKRVLADDGIHMATVRGVGLKRVSATEAAATIMPSKLSRARSAAKSCTKTAEKISVLELPVEQRASFAARATLASLIADATTQKSVAKLAAAASTQGENTAIIAGKMALKALMSGDD